MGINNKFANTHTRSIQEILQVHGKYKVPKFQRNYSWSQDKVEALWNDMLDNFKIMSDISKPIEDSQYLLGSIVLLEDIKDKGSYFVIDGQQRLSTLTLLLCVARDIIMEDMDKNGSIKSDGLDKFIDLIQNTQMDQHTSWKLILNDTDKLFFREIQEFESRQSKSQLERIKKITPKIKSLKYLKNNYEFLHKKITDALQTEFGNNGDISDMSEEELRELRIENHGALLYFLTHIIENNFLITLVVSDENTAFQIFETLNERGQTLSRSNLIKNYILSKITSKETQIELSDDWNRIFDEVVGDGQADDDFIIESYKSRDCDHTSLCIKSKKSIKISKKNLYTIIKNMVVDENSCKRYISELKEDAEYLSTLNVPVQYSEEDGKDYVHIINILKAKFIRVPLLAAHRKWHNNDKFNDYVRLIKILTVFFFKIRVIQQKHPGYIENIIIKVTKMINENQSINDVMKILKLEDDHENFIYNFKASFIPNPTKDAIKYVLQRITIHLGTDPDDVKYIENLSLEHILPQDHELWDKNNFFSKYEGEKNNMDEFVNRLGNMTLLRKSLNSKTKNQTFEYKKRRKDKKDGRDIGYNSSELKINKKTVCNHDIWTADIIEKRESDFLNFANIIWDLDKY
ncbi:MAG: hypothetical protein K8823_941 [Cenarchaeum symbiont of Oopsacas minuta]|nr:hypothetical protein [Cenarchaeum symbiont of Oopsacas minuta]